MVESLLREINYEDGFAGLKHGRIFDPKRLRTRAKRIRFLKLHGSITWFRWQRREGEHYRDHYVVGASYEPQKEKGVRWINDEIPTILAGSYNKHAEYNRSIFKEFMYAFHSELSEHKLIVMSGYGWGDLGINERLCEWLGRDHSHRIVLLHEQAPWSMLDSSHVIRYQWRRLIRIRKLVVMRKWLKDTTWAEILDRIAQVNKLRPCKPPSISDLLSGHL